MAKENAKFETLSIFVFFSHSHVEGLPSKRIALKVDVLQDRKKDCLQARSCIFQPGNVTGWGSERDKKNHVVLVRVWCMVTPK